MEYIMVYILLYGIHDYVYYVYTYIMYVIVYMYNI